MTQAQPPIGSGTEFMPFPAGVQAKIQSNLDARNQPRPAPGPRVRNMTVEGPAAGTQNPAPRPSVVTAQAPRQAFEGDESHIMSALADHGARPNLAPGFTQPVSEGEAVSIDLCSRFAYYPFKDLYVRPFRTRHLAKLHKAHEDSSLLHTVEAVSAVLSTSTGLPNLGFQLCVADFYHVLYWLRLHSFTKSHIQHKTMCDSPAHREQVALGKQPVESLNLVRTVTETDLAINELEVLPSDEEFDLGLDGWYLRPATMQDLLEFSEHERWLDPEFQYLARSASNIAYRDENGVDVPVSLDDRIALMEDWPPSLLAKAQKFEKLIDQIGVDETVIMTCGCGASKRSKIQLDAHSFLSALEQE